MFGTCNVLVAIVLAVYLAASSRLKQAIQFELIKGNMDSYHLQNAMLSEVNDNIDYMNLIGKEYFGGKSAKYVKKKGEFGIDKFVWKSMQFSPVLFETSSELLTPIRRYYNACDLTINKMTDKQSTVMTRNLIKETLKESQRIKEIVVPKIEANIEKLRKSLKESGVKL